VVHGLTTLFLILSLAAYSCPALSVESTKTKPATTPKSTKQSKPSSDKPAKRTPSSKPDNASNSAVNSERSKLTIAAPLDEQALMSDDLNHYLPPADVKTMLSGADDFVTLVQPSTTAINKGVAILLPDWQQSATDPRAINQLRLSLPAQGWTTMVMQPPNKPNSYPVINNKATNAAQENAKLLAPYQQSLSDMLTKVMAQAANYPGLMLVIAQGNSGEFLLDLYKKQRNKAPSALILLSAYRYTDAENQQFADLVAHSTIPILDLYLTQDNPLVMNYAAQRKTDAIKAMKVYYRQQQLMNYSPGYYPSATLQLAIKGWLKAIGW